MMADLSSDDRLLLNALADGELDASATLALERRLAAEPALGAEYQSILALKARVAGLERPQLSAEFLGRIASLAPATGARPRLPFYSGWQAIAAAVVITAFVASSATYVLTASRAGISVEGQIANAHRRSLLAASPVDIVTSDRHTVKPWLDAKLGVSPPATDLATLGYPLVGGRVDVIGTATVPTLVYRHNEHLITLMAQPGTTGSSGPTAEVGGGYNIVRWTAGGFAFWAVSDLEMDELKGFVANYRAG
jgi:anti-sigma factor RsiW